MKVYTILVSAMLIASFSSAQSVGIGTTTPAPSAALEIQSTTGALLLPRMSTAARNALAPLGGMMIYNTDLHKFQGCTLQFLNMVKIDTVASPVPRSIVAGFWIMYQSFTATTDSITAIQIVTDNVSDVPGNIQLLNGNGTGGVPLHTRFFTYAGCSSRRCITQINFSPALSVAAGNQYTLRFETTTGGLSTFTNGNNPYAGGQVWQNNNSLPNEDMFIRFNQELRMRGRICIEQQFEDVMI